ncbi:unnamed protein product [Symbiodinium sp. CCMP2592]|nr:unnamed protein product [Symbiodinium sp. CCMP2592]
MDKTSALLERQHEELLERLANQDEMLQAILEVPRMAFPFEEVKKDQHVDFVSPIASRIHSSDQEDSVKKRLSKQSKQSKQSNSTPTPTRGAPPKTTFTPPLRSFSAFDMSLKNTADAADGDRSRRRYASLRFKSPNPENNTFIAQIVRLQDAAIGRADTSNKSSVTPHVSARKFADVSAVQRDMLALDSLVVAHGCMIVPCWTPAGGAGVALSPGHFEAKLNLQLARTGKLQ